MEKWLRVCCFNFDSASIGKPKNFKMGLESVDRVVVFVSEWVFIAGATVLSNSPSVISQLSIRKRANDYRTSDYNLIKNIFVCVIDSWTITYLLSSRLKRIALAFGPHKRIYHIIYISRSPKRNHRLGKSSFLLEGQETVSKAVDDPVMNEY